MAWVTEEEYQVAKQVRAYEYLQTYQPGRLKKTRTRNEWQLQDHDSFKINEITSKWHWKSRDIGGMSALRFLMQVDGMGYTEAVKILCEQTPVYVPRAEPAPKKKPFALPMPELPPQLITYALAPKEKGEEDKVYAAIQRLLDEDITLKLGRDEENGDILLSGMGQLHIELSVEKAKRRFKIDIVLKTPKVPYRETVRGKCQVQGRHKKQSGGRGQFGDCWIEMEGLPRGSGYVFEDAIVGGVIPRQYIPAIDKGVQEAAARGFLAGCQVVDFRVKVYDGSYHTVDSSEMAFKVAGSLAFKKAIESLKPVLLEPIVLLCVSVPDEYMGDVIGDLSSRRGKVLGSDSQVGITEIKAHIPMSEVLRYAPDLRSITGGQGVFTMEFDHYEEAPQPIVDKVIAEHQKAKAEE